MTVAVNDVVRATIEMNQPSLGAIQNVYHMRNIGNAVTEVQAVADIISALETLMGVIATIVNVLQVVEGVRMLNVTPIPPTDVGFGTFVDTTPFTATGQIMPAQVSSGINLHTARLAVSGRKYLGIGVVGNYLNGGTVTAGTITTLTAFGNAMLADQVETNTTWEFGVRATLDSAFLQFQSFSMPTMAIIQRRRRETVGI